MPGPGEGTAFVLVSDESHLASAKKQAIWKGLQDLSNLNQWLLSFLFTTKKTQYYNNMRKFLKKEKKVLAILPL